MNIPRWISHNDIKLSQYFKIKISQVTVYPLCKFNSLPIKLLILGFLLLLIFFNVMYQFAFGVMACVQMWTIAITLISVLGDNSSEMFFITMRMTFCFLTFVSCAMITIFNIFLFFKFLELQLLFICFEQIQVFFHIDLM